MGQSVGGQLLVSADVVTAGLQGRGNEPWLGLCASLLGIFSPLSLCPIPLHPLSLSPSHKAFLFIYFIY